MCLCRRASKRNLYLFMVQELQVLQFHFLSKGFRFLRVQIILDLIAEHNIIDCHEPVNTRSFHVTHAPRAHIIRRTAFIASILLELRVACHFLRGQRLS